MTSLPHDWSTVLRGKSTTAGVFTMLRFSPAVFFAGTHPTRAGRRRASINVLPAVLKNINRLGGINLLSASGYVEVDGSGNAAHPLGVLQHFQFMPSSFIHVVTAANLTATEWTKSNAS
jgi:hypothetical protein